MRDLFYLACADGDLTAVQTHAAAHDLDLARGLCLAAQAGQTEVVAYLLSLGVHKTPKAPKVADALFLASQNGHADVVRLLLAAKISPNTQEKYTRRRPLHAAATHNRVEVLRLLLAAKAKPDMRDGDGATPLAEAVLNQRQEAAALLVAAGADIQAKARDGSTPLSIALAQKDEDMVILLTGQPMILPTHPVLPAPFPSEAELEPLMQELIALGQSKGFINDKGRKLPRARQIGRWLAEQGGLPLMQAVYRKIATVLPGPAVRDLEKAWDGVGPWLA